jgi:hypothetical protein
MAGLLGGGSASHKTYTYKTQGLKQWKNIYYLRGIRTNVSSAWGAQDNNETILLSS